LSNWGRQQVVDNFLTPAASANSKQLPQLNEFLIFSFNAQFGFWHHRSSTDNLMKLFALTKHQA
jgi:hypothetical protein